MKHFIVSIMVMVMMAGCATMNRMTDALDIGEMSDEGFALAEGVGMAMLMYKLSDIEDKNERGIFAIEQANIHLATLYDADTTLQSLIYNQVNPNPATRRLISIARLVLTAEGKLTGNTWAEALLTVDSMEPLEEPE